MMMGNNNEARSGTFGAHVLAASFFLGFGVFFLVLDLQRARACLERGESFCKLHVPEKNRALLRRAGLVLFTVSMTGVLLDGVVAFLYLRNFFFQLLHQTLYLSFGFVGFIAYLESKRRLPLDSSRVALAIALLLFHLVMSAHAKMKPGSTDAALHAVMANLCLVHALIYAFSVWNPKSLVAYVMTHALLVVQGVWLVTLGSFECCMDIPLHLVETLFSLELLTVFAAIVVTAITVLPPLEDEDGAAPSEHKNGPNSEEYAQLVPAASVLVDDSV
ncbi:expressed unknown protein [Seminavis robusta]|uniref:Uncharacterized protein n=1 Tax=Seminavis robusta TaxID=568900 RepID=A0A9N8DDC4_9STRA|nr:expressed unknown protein [Seminavis robusta]|eukprot:Sro95_g049230.1 n/a (275) ;mRNA; f:39543-40367